MISDQRNITVVIVKSIFTMQDREIRSIPWRENLTVADVTTFDNRYPEVEFAHSVNGRYTDITQIIMPGDCIAVCPVPQGGGDKNPLRVIAMIAVAIVSAMTGNWVGVQMGLQGALATAVGTSIVMTAGSMLVNAVLPPAAPDIPQLGRDTWNESPTYGWGQLRQTEGQGRCIPILFGEVRTAGHVITKFVETSGQKQYYNLMLGVCDGADSVTISNIELNDQPVYYFDGITTYTREGGINDEAIPGFDQVVSQQDFSSKLIYNNAVQAQTSGNAVQRIEIDVTAPYGIFYANNAGTLDQRQANVKVEYRLVGAGSWTLHGTTIISGATSNPVRKTIALDLSAGEYEIQLTRTNTESTSTRERTAVYFVSMREIVKRELIYPGLAKYAITALATDQLSGAEPSVTCTVTRATVQVWNPTTEVWDTEDANNPGWAYYALANTYHGIPVDRMLYDEIKAFADYCAEDVSGRPRFKLGILLDTATDFWTQANLILQIGRARPIRRGSKYGLVADMPSTPVQLFSMGVIDASTFKMDYLAFPDRANCVEVTFQDEDRDHTTQTIAVYTDEYDDETEPDNRASKRLFGCPNRKQAIADAAYLINTTNNLIRTVEFGVDIDALATQVGDLFYFNHEVPLWGNSGRIIGATPGTITLDKTVTYNAENSYAALVRTTDDTIFDKTITTVVDGEWGENNSDNVVDWVLGDATIASSGTTDPGGAAGYTITDADALAYGGAHSASPSNTIDDVWEARCYIEKDSDHTRAVGFYLQGIGGTPAGVTVRFYTDTGEFSTAVGTGVTLISADVSEYDGWWLVSIYCVLTTTATTARLYIYPAYGTDLTPSAAATGSVTIGNVPVLRKITSGDVSTAFWTTPLTATELAKFAKYDPYQFGTVASYKRIYRCVSVSRDGDLKKQISGWEYNEALLTATKVIELPDIPLDYASAYGVFVHEFMGYSADGTYQSNIGVSWHTKSTVGSQTWEVWLKNNSADTIVGPYLTSMLSMVFPSGNVVIGNTYTVYVVAAGRGPVNDGTNTATLVINGKDDPPPDVAEFMVEQLPDGTRQFTMAMTDRPIDFAGFQIRYKLGASATWSEMAELTSGVIKYSPFESNQLPAGTYVFGCKALDTSGNESTNDIQIVAELGDPRLGSVVAAAYPSGVWGGTLTDCWHDPYTGYLVAVDTKTWADFATDGITWDTWTTWARSPETTISYEHTEIDLGAALPVTPLVTVGGTGTQTIEMNYSTNGVDYSGWVSLSNITARYFKFRVTMVVSAGTLAVISSMRILLSGDSITEEVNDLDTSTLSASYRVAAGHIYLPLTKDFNTVTQIQSILQSVGAGWSVVVVDKTTTVSGKLAPEIKIYDGTDTLADAVIDAYARGV